MSGRVLEATDARSLRLPDSSADLVVTSPPYWRKRDYGVAGQIGQEDTVDEYVDAIGQCLAEWRRVLRPHGSVFLNVGDTMHRGSLAGVPVLIERAAVEAGWRCRNRIIWTKEGGMPDPARDRLVGRHEYVLHLTPRGTYYYDLFGYSQAYGNGSNPGDVWSFEPERNLGKHLAPYPTELVERCITLACPERVCRTCGKPSVRITKRSDRLDVTRPQARRAMELATAANLTPEHFAAIRATGISDTGKAQRTHSGFGRNSDEVKRLAGEAKAVLGGYFREFTCAPKLHDGWTDCGHGDWQAGTVLDPFVGTGTTLRAAANLGRIGLGSDLDLSHASPHPAPGDGNPA